MRRSLLTIFLIMILAAHGLGNAEQALEQARGIEDMMEAGDTSAGTASSPMRPAVFISHQLTALQFSSEAGGLGASCARKTLSRVVSGSERDNTLRLLTIAIFLLIIIAAIYSGSLYILLSGVFTTTAGRVAVSYIHAKDGSK